MNSDMGQNGSHGMAAWADPQQHGLGAKGEDDKPGNICSEDHLLFDEDNATVEGNDLLFTQVQSEITLSSESCLFCKTQLMGKPREYKSTREVLNITMCSKDCCEFPQDPEGIRPAYFSGQFTVWDRSALVMFSQRLWDMITWGCVHRLLLPGTEQYLTQPFP